MDRLQQLQRTREQSAQQRNLERHGSQFSGSQRRQGPARHRACAGPMCRSRKDCSSTSMSPTAPSATGAGLFRDGPKLTWPLDLTDARYDGDRKDIDHIVDRGLCSSWSAPAVSSRKRSALSSMPQDTARPYRRSHRRHFAGRVHAVDALCQPVAGIGPHAGSARCQ